MFLWEKLDAVITILFNRKGVKGSPDNIGMPFAQLCQEATVSILQVCSLQIIEERDWIIDACPIRSG